MSKEQNDIKVGTGMSVTASKAMEMAINNGNGVVVFDAKGDCHSEHMITSHKVVIW